MTYHHHSLDLVLPTAAFVADAVGLVAAAAAAAAAAARQARWAIDPGALIQSCHLGFPMALSLAHLIAAALTAVRLTVPKLTAVQLTVANLAVA